MDQINLILRRQVKIKQKRLDCVITARNYFSWKRKQAEEENGKNTSDFIEELEIPKALNIAEESEELPWLQLPHLPNQELVQ